MSVPIELVAYPVIRDSMLPAGATLTYRTLARMSAAGEFPPGVRLSPKNTLLWPRRAVEAWISEKLAPVIGEPTQ